MINSIKGYITKFGKYIKDNYNPEPEKGSDYLVDYLVRVLLFLFPLYVYETEAIMGISIKAILFGIIILIMSIWAVSSLLLQGKLKRIVVGKKMLAIFGIFLLVLICFAVQVAKLSNELAHTYIYIGIFLLPFCVSRINKGRKCYMNIFLASYIIVYLFILGFVITGKDTLIGVEKLLFNSSELIPSLLLVCAIGAFLYISEDEAYQQKFYLVITVVSMVILFMYGDMAAYMILLLYIMCLQFLRIPTKGFIKRNLILLFAFAFCASNTPLITYFGVKGYSREFDLEYSIYIDIIIAVTGLIISSYWDKLPKDQGDDAVLTRFSKWFRRSILFVIGLIAIAFIYGSRGGNLSNAVGGKAIAGFSVSLWNAVSRSSGELWHVLTVYGVIGVVVMLLLWMIAASFMYRTWNSPETEEVSKGYILLTVLFLVQSFFYPYTVTSTPAYLIFMGFALSEGRRSQYKESATQEDNRFAIGYFPWIGALFLSLLSAALLFMLFFAGYRIINPLEKAGSDETLLQTAFRHRQDVMLADLDTDLSEGGIEDSIEAISVPDVIDPSEVSADKDVEDVAVLEVSEASEDEVIDEDAVDDAETENEIEDVEDAEDISADVSDEATEEASVEEATKEASTEEATEEASAEEIAPQKPAQEAEAQEPKKQEAKPKAPVAYTLQWANDNKKITIWSAGVLQGTMTVTDGEGQVLPMANYGDYYDGSGKNQKRYLNVYVKKGETELIINADGGFVSSLKAMGYDGLYFNKSIHNW